jgi:uncharacterized membrane protein YfhO
VTSAHGVSVIRAVAAIPGWSATWQPQRGPAVTLAVRRVGLVQAVAVPAGPGVLTWSYTPPGFSLGLLVSLASAAAIVIIAAAALAAAARGRGRTLPDDPDEHGV